MAITRLGLYGGPRAAFGAAVTIALTGVVATAAVGTLDLTKSGSLALTGVEATTAVGSVTASSGATIALTGASSTSAVGSVGFAKAGSIAVTGVSASGAVGSVGFAESGSAALTGVSATGSVGTVTPQVGASIALTGVNSTTAVGSLSFTKSGLLVITGVSSTGQVGLVGAPVVEEGAPTGGWRNVYDHYFQLKRKRDDAHKQEMAEIAALAGTDREIARILHKDLEFDARSQEIAKLDEIIQSLDVNTERQRLNDEVSEKAAKAFTRAYMQANFSALEAFERELQKTMEEEDFMLLALLILR